MNPRALVAFGVLAFCVIACSAHAQTLPPGVGGSGPITFTLAPDHPAPGDSVTVTAANYDIDMSRAQITWKVNGAVTIQGEGRIEAEIPTDQDGKPSTVSVTASQNGSTVSGSVVIYPASVDMVIESDGTAPPLYEGRTLVAWGSQARVASVPHVAGNLDPTKLMYTWYRNWQIDQSASGIGRQIYSVSDVKGSTPVMVQVTSAAGVSLAQGVTTIETTQPMLILYEDNPLLGPLYEHTLSGNLNLAADEITITGVPYFFSAPTATDSSIPYTWSLNGNAVSANTGTPDEITLRQTGSGSGNATLSVGIQHQNILLQGAQAQLTVTYSKSSSPAAFVQTP